VTRGLVDGRFIGILFEPNYEVDFMGFKQLEPLHPKIFTVSQ